MWNRGGIRSSALERAKAQLSGQRVTNSGTLRDDQRRDVVSASFGKALHSRHMPLHESELSSDAESEKQVFAEPVEQFGMGGSRFLKKSAHRRSCPASTSEVKIIPQRGSQSVALSRLALIEDRFRNRTNSKLGVDTGADLRSGLSVQSSSELSTADGSRFLKKKASTPKGQKEPERPHAEIYMAPAHSASRMQKGLSVDSDEEDMRRLLGESFESPDGVKGMRQTEMNPQQAVKTYRKSSKELVIPAPEHKEKQPVLSAFTAQHHKRPSPSPPSSRKVSSPSRPLSQRADLTLSLSPAPDHSEIRSLEELFPIANDYDDTQSERSVLSDDFKLNVMTLDDLAPDTLDIGGLSKEKSDTSPQELSVASAGEIVHNPDEPAWYESDFESEIQTETAQGVDDISEHLSGGNERSLVASEHQSLSAKLNSDDDDYTPSEKPSKTTSVRYSSSESSLSHSRGSDTPSYSSGTTHTHTSPQRPSVPRRFKKDATVQTKAEGLAYMWSSDQAMLGPSVGMSYMDPTPVASHMISADAVEALTAYSPAVFALNDMLRQQLTLTRSFIQSIRHLHKAMLESLGPAEYKYTTLEDTKEFIRCNRPLKLPMEDAMEEVLQEMRDYHYI